MAGGFANAGSCIMCQRVVAWDGINFIDVGDMPTAWGLQVFNNELYMVGGWGSLAKYAGGTSWVSVGGST
ncbi:MAG: hypothetical protein ABIJ97_01660, partial [Bacteroidota bacterium]